MLSRSYSFALASPLRAPAEQVWAHASSLVGINRELWPLARMTYPATLRQRTLDAVPLGRRAFRSWNLLLGFLLSRLGSCASSARPYSRP